MDQLPRRGSNGFANNNLFADSQQQFNAYDSLYPSTGVDQTSLDSSAWGVNVNPGTYPVGQSRAQHVPSPSWPQNANQNPPPSSHITNLTGQHSPYPRSLSQSPAPYGNAGFSGYPPQNFQYQQNQPQYDPALFQQPASTHGQKLNYSGVNYQALNTGTIAPQALEHAPRPPASNARQGYAQNYPSQQRIGGLSSNNVVDQKQLIGSIPTGADAGLFSIINFDQLARATSSTRMGNYINIGNQPLTWDCNRAAPPAYVPRKSRNELRKAAGNDASILAKIGQKSTKLKRIAAAPKTIQAASRPAFQSADKIRYEGEVVSDDESSSSSDDDSDYTSDEGTESAPVPSKKPTDPKAAIEYDTIKAVWRNRRKGTSSESITKGLVEFWEIAKNIRDIWKADTNAVEEANKRGQKAQLSLLESRVKDQRDMMEVVFKALLKHGHRNIIEVMSENEPLIYLCYQFLLDRFKSEDFNSPLPRAMLETMTMWNSLTQERLDKTHLTKVLMRFTKRGDAKTKYYSKKIETNAKVASQGKATEPAVKKGVSNAASTDSPTQRVAQPVAGVKRSAASTGDEGGPAKKVASGATKTTGAAPTSKLNGVVRKGSIPAVGAKTSAATATTPAVKTKQVVAKPSGIFSSLSAAKRPGTSNAARPTSTSNSTASKLAQKKSVAAPKSTFSFLETMKSLEKPKEEPPVQTKAEKSLPPETAEEKAKRLRKESRRHLRVSFKNSDELTEVRYFTHDPDEEAGHDASQVRDVSDVGGEGRMFKQQQQLMEDDDDEEMAERDEKSLIAFKEPSPIDFSDVDASERERNYVQCGGGKIEPESKERPVRDHYEANNLIIFYTSPDDIPPSPREPADPYSGESVDTVTKFAVPPEQFATRARQKRQLQAGWQNHQQQMHVQGAQGQAFDMSKLNSLIAQPPAQQQQLDISSILANLSKATTNQPTPPPQPQMGGFQSNYQPPQPMMNMQAPQPALQQPPPQVDLAAILASISAQPNAGQPPAMGSGYGAPAPSMSFGQPNAGAAQQQWQRGGSGTSGSNGGSAGDNTPEGRRWYRTKVCRFWQEGTCQKGDACTYKHSD